MSLDSDPISQGIKAENRGDLQERISRDFLSSKNPTTRLRSQTAPLVPSILTVGETKLLAIPFGDSHAELWNSGVAIYTAPKQVKRLRGKGDITIGRETGAEISVPSDSHVSREHAKIQRRPDGGFDIVDTVSTNGTKLQAITTMKHGSLGLLSAEEWIRIDLGNGSEATLRFDTDSKPEVKISGNNLMIRPTGKEKTLLNEGIFYLGRGSMSEAPIAEEDLGLSRAHVMCIREGDTLLIKRVADASDVQISVGAIGGDKKELMDKGTIQTELVYWRNSQLKSGTTSLEIAKEEEDNFGRFDEGEFAFIAPKNTNPKVIRKIAKIMNGVMSEIRQYQEIASTPLTTAVTLVPTQNFPRGGAAGKNRMILGISDHLFGTAAHEAAHVVLRQQYGECFLDFVAEGVAMFFEGKEDPSGIRRYKKRGTGANSIALVGDQVEEVSSHTNLVEKFGKTNLSDGEIYEYSYIYGVHFVEYMIKQFGMKTFLEFYKYASSAQTPTLADSANGHTLVDKGQRVGMQREIATNILDTVARDKGVPELQSTVFLRNFKEYLSKQ